MSIPRKFAAVDPEWYVRRSPTLEDFDGDEAAFDQAMADYVTLQNGPQLADVPNFGIPEQQVFNHQTGQYETRGGMPKRFEGMSEGEFYGNYPSGRAFNPLIPVSELTDEELRRARAAYDSTRADGTPVMADPMLAWMEDRFGFAPNENAMWSRPVSDTGQTPEEKQATRDAWRNSVGLDVWTAEQASRRAAAQPDSPFGPEDTWTVLPDGRRVNGVGDVWEPGQGTLLPGSNPNAAMVAQEGAGGDVSWEDIIAAAIAEGGIPGAPGFSREVPPELLGLGPQELSPADQPGFMNPEQYAEWLRRMELLFQGNSGIQWY